MKCFYNSYEFIKCFHFQINPIRCGRQMKDFSTVKKKEFAHSIQMPNNRLQSFPAPLFEDANSKSKFSIFTVLHDLLLVCPSFIKISEVIQTMYSYTRILILLPLSTSFNGIVAFNFTFKTLNKLHHYKVVLDQLQKMYLMLFRKHVNNI